MQRKSPFFATLAFNIDFSTSSSIPTAATDGKRVIYNEEFFETMSKPERMGVLLHELLHVVFRHALRVGNRDRFIWNLAADIYCNTIITDLNYCKLPQSAVNEPALWRDTTEEIYEELLKEADICKKYENGCGESQNSISDLLKPGDLSKEELESLEREFKNILQRAETVAKTKGKGEIPGRLERELKALTAEKIDWRQILQNFLISFPNDFKDYDRRFLYQNLYLDALQGDKLRVAVCIDTSGSIGSEELTTFTTELKAILRCHPQIECYFYWADHDLYGPYELKENTQVPRPKGGGGTSFVPFFDDIQKMEIPPSVAVYFTDGYGTFPEPPRELQTLWLTTALPPNKYPFGKAIPLKV